MFAGDTNCVVVSTNATGGSGGGGSSDPGGGGGGGTARPDPCAKYAGRLYTFCRNNVGGQCLSLYDQSSGTLPIDQLNQLLTDNGCPAVPAGAVPPSPATLAQQAADSMLLPDPTAGRYPASTLRDGRPYTGGGCLHLVLDGRVDLEVVHGDGAGGWELGDGDGGAGLAVVHAGDGHAAVSCAGPGSVWRNGVNGPWEPSPSGCQYRYPHSSIHDPNEEVTATYTITWQLTWTGSGNTAGTLTAKTTNATATFAVAEVESVVTH
jgi:hypothetical protein